MSARMVAIPLAAALFGAAVADSVLAHGRSTGASGQGRSSAVAGFRAPMPSTQARGAIGATPNHSGRTHIHSGRTHIHSSTTHIASGKPAFPHHKHFHHHGHGTVFVTTGVLWPAYYPFYPYYPGQYYAPPPSVWYYCPAYGAYYPYVSECPSGWQVVQPFNY